MNTTDDVFTKLRDFLAHMLDTPPTQIKPESRLWDDLDLDSMLALELTVYIEDNYFVDFEAILRSQIVEHRLAADDGTSTMTVGWVAAQIAASEKNE